MVIVNSVSDLQARIDELRKLKKSIALVPTLGNLHVGHLQLIKVAHEHADFVICSIFVNPMQFGEDEDLDAYPRTPEQDQAALEKEKTDILFMPDVETVYPRGMKAQTYVEVPGISDELCGEARPGHFRGVTTVVNRLFNLVQPDAAIFGKKDYQQLLIIKLMVRDLGMPVEIVGVDTVREPDGLAMSSRNRYLSSDERMIVSNFHATLESMRDQLVTRGTFSPGIENDASVTLAAMGFKPDYVSVRRQSDLATPGDDDKALVILAAAWLGKTRLIDNVEVNLQPN